MIDLVGPDRLLDGLDARDGAIIVVDVQRSFADPAFLGGYGLDAAAAAGLVAAIERMRVLIDGARALGLPVVWVELASDPSAPWESSNWLHGGDPLVMSDEEPCIVGTPGAEWYGVQPADGELRVAKSRYSGFLGTELDGLLGAAGVRWVAVTGLTTECCVASTANDAMQLGYPVLLPVDAAAAYEVRLHENAVEQLALSVAKPTTVDALLAAVGAQLADAEASSVGVTVVGA